MGDVLWSALRDATYGWLNRLEALALNADLPSRTALAQTEMMRLVAAWRALLGEHEPDDDGRCRRCPRRLARTSRPCAVWVVAHRYLVVNDAPDSRIPRHSMTSIRIPSRQGR